MACSILIVRRQDRWRVRVWDAFRSAWSVGDYSWVEARLDALDREGGGDGLTVPQMAVVASWLERFV